MDIFFLYILVSRVFILSGLRHYFYDSHDDFF